MTDLLAARAQMGLSLAFHMVFATLGVGLPLLMCIAEAVWLQTGDPLWLDLAKRQGKTAGILFAVGAVSGTVLSFELGLLWPVFMEHAGPVVGMPFSLEGFAFFFEAIFLGIWLYGWGRVPPLAHWLAGVGVTLSGASSAAFVVCANAWMNTPRGFRVLPDGTLTDIDPVAAMFNPSSLGQVLHMLLAAYLSTGFLIAGTHAWALLRRPGHPLHVRAFAVALIVAVIGTGLQPAAGHIAADVVAEYQPIKFAALEGLWETQAGAPFTVGGWADAEHHVTRYALEIPYALSLLVHLDPNGVVQGLDDFPAENHPPVALVHLAYEAMLAAMAMLGVTSAVSVALAVWYRKIPQQRWYLRMVIATAPVGLFGLEAGWMATELGRQPWVVTGFLRTADAVTPMPGLWAPFLVFSALYVFLAVTTAVLLRRHVEAVPDMPAVTA